MLPIDTIAQTNRWRDRSPTEKLTLAGGMLALSVMLPPWPAAPLIFVLMVAAALGLARVDGRAYLRVLVLPIGFLASGAMMLALGLETSGGIRLVFDPAGLPAALAASGRALAALSCLLLLVLTTPVTDLLPGLRRLRVPEPIIDIMMLTYRFVFMALETARSMHSAQAARLGYGDRRRGLRSLGLLIAALLPRIMSRAERMETGLAARGYDGMLRVLSRPRPASKAGMAGALAALALVAGVSLWAA